MYNTSVQPAHGHTGNFIFFITIAARTCVGQHVQYVYASDNMYNTYTRRSTRTTRITHTHVKLCVSQYWTNVGQCLTPTQH